MKACKVLELLGITRRTLNNYVKTKKIRTHQLNNGFYDYDDADVRKLEANIISKNEIIIHQEIGSKHIFKVTYDQTVKLLDIISDFLKQ